MFDGSYNELSVITHAKELCSYVLTVTQKSPKHFRYTFVSRLQNLALDVVEQLFRANEVFVKRGDARAAAKRIEHQRNASTSLKLLIYMAQVAYEQGCILMKQYEQISTLGLDCRRELGAWINSDKKRFHSDEEM
ncbi:MAG: four helix bundle protein [Coriobacteriales bacterium]|nr:four helix bundle protein [Coriobacteriales bacterium]